MWGEITAVFVFFVWGAFLLQTFKTSTNSANHVKHDKPMVSNTCVNTLNTSLTNTFLVRVRHRENLQGEVFWRVKGCLKGIFGKSSPWTNPRKNTQKPTENQEKPKKNQGNIIFPYAPIEIVVTFLVVKIFGFLVIARYRTMRFWRKLEEMLPFSLPDLSKPKF